MATQPDFDNISAQIQMNIQLGSLVTGDPGPCDDLPFIDNFYDGPVNFDMLLNYIRSGYNKIFDSFMYHGPYGQRNGTENARFEYQQKEECKTANLTIRLNNRVCYLEKAQYGLQYSWQFILQPEKGVIRGVLVYYYKGTYALRQSFETALDEERSLIEYKYLGIIIEAEKCDDYIALLRMLGKESMADFAEEYIIKKFISCLKNSCDPAELKFLYTNIPGFVVEHIKKTGAIGEDILWDHVQILTEYDNAGIWRMFKDASSALIRLFGIFENHTALYKRFSADQKFVKRVYRNMDSSSVIEGQELSNKIIFAAFMSGLCNINNREAPPGEHTVFEIGGNRLVKGNITGANEADDEFYLRQQFLSPPADFLPEIFWDHVDSSPGGMFKPLDMVTLITGDGPDYQSLYVPAVYIKALADREELEEIMLYIRIGFDILAVIAGVITISTPGNPIIFALAMVEIGLSVTDIAVQAFRKEIEAMDGGKEFLNTWESVYLGGTLLTAAPAIIRATLGAGARLLHAAEMVGNGSIRKFVTTQLSKIILEINIANFTRNTVKEIIYGEEVLADIFPAGIPKTITPLQNAGLMLIKGTDAAKKVVAVAAVYKGEIIAEGTAAGIRQFLKDIWVLEGEALIRELDILWKLVPKLDETKKFWTAVNRAGTELRWANQQKDVLNSIETALKSKKSSKAWEAQVAKAFSEIDNVLNFRCDVENMSKLPIETAGEFDILTDRYFVECKESLSMGKIRSGGFENQLAKYKADGMDINCINTSAKKVIIVIEKLGRGLNVNKDPLKIIIKNTGITVISDIRKIKNLK